MYLRQSTPHPALPAFQRAFALLTLAALLFALNAPIASRTAPDLLARNAPAPPLGEAATRARVEQAFGQLPLYFVENGGQVDERVAYYIQGSDKTIYFTPEGVTFALTAPPTDAPILNQKSTITNHYAHTPTPPYSRWAVKLDFVGANPDVRPAGQAPTEAVISYFKSAPDEWHTGLRTYRRLVYADLWPGIDLVYHGTVNQLKYEFVVQPGADPAQIKLAYRGTTEVRLNEAGQLEVTTPLGGFADDVPVAYQDIGGQRVPVSVAYGLLPSPHGRGAGGEVSYGFHVGHYDPTHPLVLDPAVLVYAGYIGGAGGEGGYGIAVDGAGNAFVTGETSSTEATFPVADGPDLTYNGGEDAFVAKVNPAGTGLLYAGYIGGTGGDYGVSISVDGAGNSYVTGITYSTQTSFPVTGGPDLTFNGGNFDVFVAQVNPSGTGLVYAGYIGGAGSDGGYGIAVDGAGNAYVTGGTTSTEATFPVTGGPDLTFNGSTDAFVAKVNPAGTGLVYAGYIGGAGPDFGGGIGGGIAVDGAGAAYVTGSTSSTEATFPVTGGPDLTYNGGQGDAFVAKVNPAGTGLVYAGYIGGAGWDSGYGIAVDGAGNAYITGFTSSTQATFPVADGPDLTFNGGGSDAFVTKVNPAGIGLVYAGYIGGDGSEDRAGVGVGGIAVDDAGHAYVTGFTTSTEATFPVTGGPDLTYNGGGDAFVAQVNSMGTGLAYAGYIGGAGDDLGSGIAVDGAGNAYVTGFTTSAEATFPVTGGPDLTHNGGNYDTFVAKVSVATSSNVDTYVASPALVGAPPAGVATVPIHYGNNGATLATSVVLTATLGSGPTYLGDTSGLTPTVTSSTITWSLPGMAFLYTGQFVLSVAVPNAPFGTRYPMTLALSSAGPEANAADNLVTLGVMIARQVFLPLVHK